MTYEGFLFALGLVIGICLGAGIVGQFLGKQITALAKDVERFDGELLLARAGEGYWRERAEKVIDAALIRAGAAPGPVMENSPKSPQSKAAALFAGMAIDSIDSTREGHRAS